MAKVEIIETSKALTAMEKISAKHYDTAIRIHQVTESQRAFVFDYYVIIKITMNDGEEKTRIVVVDKSGNKYTTSSKVFIETLRELVTECKEEGVDFDDDVTMKIVEKPSKTYEDKVFYVCSLA